MGKNYSSWTNWQIPQFQNTSNFSGFPYYNPTFNMPSFWNYSSQSNLSEEELKRQQEEERIKQEEEELKRAQEALRQAQEQKEALTQAVLKQEVPNQPGVTLGQVKQQAEEQKQKLEEKKKEVAKPKKKKKDKWRWLKNLGNTVANIGKSLIGFDENGKFSLKNCLINVGLTALCFIPGGQIAAGAAWAVRGLQIARAAKIGATVAKTVSVAKKGAVAYGAVAGTVGTVQGIQDLKRAKTDEEIDAAQQKIMGNGIIAGLSIVGGKSMMKKPIKSEFKYYDSMAKASASGTEGSITGSHWKKLDYSVKNNVLQESCAEQLAKMQDSSAQIAQKQNIISRYEAQIERCKATNAPKSKIKTLEQGLAKEKQRLKVLEKQQAKFGTMAPDEIAAKQYVLEQQQQAIKTLNELQSASRSEFKNLLANNKSNILKGFKYDKTSKMYKGQINGRDVSISKSAYKELNNLCKTYNRTLTEVVEAKEAQMRRLAKNCTNEPSTKAELDAYLRGADTTPPKLTTMQKIFKFKLNQQDAELQKYNYAFANLDKAEKLKFSQKYPTIGKKLYGGTKNTINTMVIKPLNWKFSPFRYAKYTKPTQDIIGVSQQDNFKGMGFSESEQVELALAITEQQLAVIQNAIDESVASGMGLNQVS